MARRRSRAGETDDLRDACAALRIVARAAAKAAGIENDSVLRQILDYTTICSVSETGR